MKCNYLKNLKLDKQLECDTLNHNNNHEILTVLYPLANDKKNIDLYNNLKNGLNKIFINSNYTVEINNNRSYEGAHNYKVFIHDKDLAHTFKVLFWNGFDDLISLKKEFITILPSLTEEFNKAYIEYIINSEEFNILSEDYLLEMQNILEIKNKQKVFQ